MSDFSSTSFSAARQPVARITGQHGYFIDGDAVHLNADIEWNDRALASSGASAWALQLWARPTCSAANADSIKVAELPLPQVAEGQPLPQRVEGWGFAVPPAGAEAYTMVLELRTGDGQRFDTVHDQVAFARDERFVQPRLSGTGGYRFEGAQLRLEVDRIENPRAQDNLSGSLSLELWASDEPYRGGDVRGHRVGSVALGRLGGQAHWSPVAVDATTLALPAGRWWLSLMLREWTAAGWVTRDYIGFAAPHRVAEEVVEPTVVAAQVLPSALAEVVKDAPVSASTVGAVSQAVTPVAAPKPKAASAKKPKAAATTGASVSINAATEAELASVKGLPKALAQAIVAARPHASLEALLKVKGMGPKLLEKLRASLRA